MTTKTDTEQERADFEAAYAAEFQFAAGRPGKFDLDANDDYEDVQVLVGWRMWQAGRAALQSQDREDAARLDWLQQSDGRFHKLLHITSIVGRGFSPTKSSDMWFSSLREAIDHARRIEGEAK